MEPLRRLLAFYALQLRLVRTWRLGRRALVRRLVLTSLIAWLAFAAAVALVPGIEVPGGAPSILGAVVLIAVLNAILRPVVLAVAVPLGILVIAVLAVGLQFLLVLIVGAVVPGLRVAGPPAAVEGALVFSVVNASIGWFVALGEDESYYAHLIRLLIRRQPGVVESDVPGLVIVQIDGLARPVLLNQVRAGRVPTMSRWIRAASHRLTPWEVALPSQTSASQAGILFGRNDGIPAFRWFEKATGRLMVSNRPADAAEVERRLSHGDGLLVGGSSIGNLFSGDAAESILTMSRLGHGAAALGPARSWFYFFVSPFAFARAVFLTLGEASKELWQARRQSAAGVEPRIDRGGSYPLLRGITNVLLRQVSLALVAERILRGVPIVYVDFTDYDEIGHHAGPGRGEALDALDGIDRVIGALQQVATEAPRPYRFVVLSDHGQSQGATFRQRFGLTISELLRKAIGGEVGVRPATAAVEPWGPINALLSELGRGGGLGTDLLGRALRSRSSEGFVELGPGREQSRPGTKSTPRQAGPSESSSRSGGTPDELVVCASGNLALVYFTRHSGRVSLERLAELHPGLVEAVAGHPGIGFVLVRSDRFGALVLGAAGRHYLDDDRVEGEDPLAPFGPDAPDDLRRLDGMPNVGDLVLNSRLDPDTDEVAAFEELVGSHGGLGGWQTSAFVLHPSEWPAGDAPLVGGPMVHDLLAGWRQRAETGQATEPLPVSGGQTR